MVSRGIHPALVDFLRLALAACLAFVTACADIAIAPIPIVTLGGSVATPKGAPVQGVEIYFIPASTAPSLGTLTPARLAPRPPAGTVSPAAGFAEETIFSRRFNSVAVAGPTTIDLAFTGITWSGVVREAGTGTPIPGAIVRVVGDDYYGYLGKARSTTDGTGAFKLYLASPQAYRLTATASGYAPIDPVEASAGSDSTFDLTLNFSSAP